MRRFRERYPVGLLGWPLGFALATALLVLLCRQVLPWHKIAPDFIQFWAAGELIASGRSPYDVEAQASTQRQYGWDKETDGLGRYDFLPYYYPPWLSLVCTLLLPLGYPTARLTWFVLQLELALLSGYLLRHRVAGLPRWVPIVFVPVFAFMVLAILMGQVAPLILFLIVAGWRLLEGHRDRSAGWVLAWLTIKPQLTLILLPAVLLWALRRGRWQVFRGFVVGSLVLLLASTLLVPDWLRQMLHATEEVPLITVNAPWAAVTWYSLLRTAHLPSWIVWATWFLAATPLTLLMIRTARDPARPIAEVLALGILSAFFVSPYVRVYDFPILIIPLLLLLDGRLGQLPATLFLVSYLVIPYALLGCLPKESPMRTEVCFFWMPFLLALVWAALCSKRREPARSSTRGRVILEPIASAQPDKSVSGQGTVTKTWRAMPGSHSTV